MQKGNSTSHFIQIVCALSLFLLFSVCSLLLVSIGANNYKGILGETDKSFNTNASLHYVANKLHSYDKPNGVSLETMNDVQVLVLNEDTSLSGYHTLIYYYQGYIYELLKQKRLTFVLGNGEKILPVQSFALKIKSENVIEILAVNRNSEQISTSISLKCVDLSEVVNDAS